MTDLPSRATALERVDARGRRAKRVCIIRHSYYPADDRPRREAEALRDAGFFVEVICLRGPGERAEEEIDGVRVVRVPLGRKRGSQLRYLADYSAFFAAASLFVARRHLRWPYGVVQVNTLPDALVFAATVPKLMGAKVILDMHELMPELYATKYGLSDRNPLVKVIATAERLASTFSDAIITVSDMARAHLVARGIPDDKLVVVMNSPDERYFRRRPGRPALDDGNLRIVSHGTLVERYGFDTTIAAVRILREYFPNIRLTIYGEGEFEPRLKNLTMSLDLVDHVEFGGFLPLHELGAAIAEAHVGVAANKIDDFTRFILPTKLLDYVMTAVPAVVTKSPAVTAYFDDSCVSFARSGDPADLARAIRRLATDLEAAEAMANRAAARYIDVYGWERMKARYVDLVANLAAAADRQAVREH